MMCSGRTRVDEGRFIQAASSAPVVPMPDFPVRVSQQRQRQLSDLANLIAQIRSESADYLLFAREHVRQVDRGNARLIRTLGAATGQDLGEDRESWRKWWAEERGYAYEPPAFRPRQDLTLGDDKPTYYNNVHLSCFAAGTPVRTLAGPRPIESIEIGDQVLTQDPRTGALSYQPVIEAPHNKPDRLYKIDLGRERDQGHGHPPVLEGRARLGHGPRPQAGRRHPRTGRCRDGQVGRAGRRRAGL